MNVALSTFVAASTFIMTLLFLCVVQSVPLLKRVSVAVPSSQLI